MFSMGFRSGNIGGHSIVVIPFLLCPLCHRGRCIVIHPMKSSDCHLLCWRSRSLIYQCRLQQLSTQMQAAIFGNCTPHHKASFRGSFHHFKRVFITLSPDWNVSIISSKAPSFFICEYHLCPILRRPGDVRSSIFLSVSLVNFWQHLPKINLLVYESCFFEFSVNCAQADRKFNWINKSVCWFSWVLMHFQAEKASLVSSHLCGSATLLSTFSLIKQ